MRCRIAEDEDPASALAQAPRDARRAHPRRRRSGVRRAAARAPARAREHQAPRPARTSSPPGGSSSSVWPRATRRCSCSRTCSGPTRAARLHRVPARLVAEPPDLRAHARPAGAAERRPTWGAGHAAPRRSTSSRSRSRPWRSCSPVSSPGFRTRLRDQILARAEGIPLYAVETVRMLLDRGLLVQEGTEYRLTGPLESLEVPETLHALIAARLDGLDAGGAPAAPGRGRPRQDLHRAGARGARRPRRCRDRAAPRSLVAQGAARRPGRPALARARPVRLPPGSRPARRLRDALEARASHAAPRGRRAPECGVRRDEDEIVEVIASHYLAAYEAAPDAEDAARSAQGAARCSCAPVSAPQSLAAAAEARRYFEQAAELAGDPSERRRFSSRAGEMAVASADPDVGAPPPRASRSRSTRSPVDTHAAARVAVRLGRLDFFTGASRRGARPRARLRRASRPTSPTRTSRCSQRELARLLVQRRPRAGAERVELALEIAEAHASRRRSSLALSAKSVLVTEPGTPRGGSGRSSEQRSRSRSSTTSSTRRAGYFILSDTCFRARPVRRGARIPRRGPRARPAARQPPVRVGRAGRAYVPAFMLGRWDEALALSTEFTQEQIDSGGIAAEPLESTMPDPASSAASSTARASMLDVLAARGLHRRPGPRRATWFAGAALHRAEGRSREALADGEADDRGQPHARYRRAVHEAGLVEAVEAALALGDTREGRGAARARRGGPSRDAAAVPRRAGAALPRAAGRRRGRLRSRSRPLP